jgi:hypothetical protein
MSMSPTGSRFSPESAVSLKAQHPNSSAINKLPADYPIFGSEAEILRLTLFFRFAPNTGHG